MRGVSWLAPVEGGNLPPPLPDNIASGSEGKSEGWELCFAR